MIRWFDTRLEYRGGHSQISITFLIKYPPPYMGHQILILRRNISGLVRITVDLCEDVKSWDRGRGLGRGGSIRLDHIMTAETVTLISNNKRDMETGGQRLSQQYSNGLLPSEEIHWWETIMLPHKLWTANTWHWAPISQVAHGQQPSGNYLE